MRFGYNEKLLGNLVIKILVISSLNIVFISKFFLTKYKTK
jgi:hypothetical protein